MLPILQRETTSIFFTKTQDRIQLWEFGFLSKAGRHTLIQSNLEALPTYLCTSSLILKAICHSINTTLHINFFWNQHKDKNGTPLIAWSTFCMPKALSGLGLCRAYPLNQAFLAKLGWKILSELDNFWVKLIKAKYLSKPAIFQCAPRSKDSYIWWKILRKGIRWKGGNGTIILFLLDNWVTNHLLFTSSIYWKPFVIQISK